MLISFACPAPSWNRCERPSRRSAPGRTPSVVQHHVQARYAQPNDGNRARCNTSSSTNASAARQRHRCSDPRSRRAVRGAHGRHACRQNQNNTEGGKETIKVGASTSVCRPSLRPPRRHPSTPPRTRCQTPGGWPRLLAPTPKHAAIDAHHASHARTLKAARSRDGAAAVPFVRPSVLLF